MNYIPLLIKQIEDLRLGFEHLNIANNELRTDVQILRRQLGIESPDELPQGVNQVGIASAQNQSNNPMSGLNQSNLR